MNILVKKTLLTLSAASALSVAVIPAVSARTIGGADGASQTNSLANCFTRQNGMVFSTCGGGTIAPYEVQLTTDNAGSKSVSFTGNNSVACSANATNSVNTAFSSSGAFASAGSALANVTLPSVTLPAGGKLWVRCDFPLNGTVATINWNP